MTKDYIARARWLALFFTLVLALWLGACSSEPTPTPTLSAPTLSAPTVIATTTPILTPTPLPTIVFNLPTLVPTATPSPVIGIVSDTLRVRSGPGTDYAQISRVQKDAKLTLLARSADGKWFQITYSSQPNQLGWVSGEFLKLQGSADALQIAQAPTPPPTSSVTTTPMPTPTQTAALAPVADPCAPIPGASYNTLLLMSGGTEPPAEIHPDLNLAIRGYVLAKFPLNLIDLEGATDPGAPQLRGLFSNKRMPAITHVYQVYAWDWDKRRLGPLMDDPEVTMLGLQTAPGEPINTPRSGSDIGDGYAALVLYASPNRITLKYTREDHVVNGYTVHIEKICVEPSLLALYQKMNIPKRHDLPALRPGQPFGRAAGTEIGVVIRDKGSFMDPRSRKDWWAGE